MNNELYRLVGRTVTAVASNGLTFKIGKLTCQNAMTDAYRIAAADDRDIEGVFFHGYDVRKIDSVGGFVHFKPFES